MSGRDLACSGVVAEGLSGDAHLGEQLVLLMEGATAFAQILPPEAAATQAHTAAPHLIDRMKRSGSGEQ